VLGRGGKIEFGTYFNLFNLGSWSRDRLSGLCLEICGWGKIGLQITYVQMGCSWDRIYSEAVTLAKDTPAVIDLDTLLPA
jgi:hypothetical protein